MGKLRLPNRKRLKKACAEEIFVHTAFIAKYREEELLESIAYECSDYLMDLLYIWRELLLCEEYSNS